MKQLTDQEIHNKLNEYLQIIIEKYPDKQILGIFAYGEINYNYSRANDDIDCNIITIPTFEELCTTTPEKVNVEIDNDAIINMFDIRCLLSYMDIGDSLITSLFSKHFIINEKYQPIYQYILKNKKMICNYGLEDRLLHMCNGNVLAMKDTELSLFNLNHLSMILDLYFRGTPYENCIYFTEPYQVKYLIGFLDGTNEDNGQEIREKLDKIEDFNPVTESQEEMHDFLIRVIAYPLQKHISKEEFVSMLTKTEAKAFMSIIDNMTESTQNVNISKLAPKYGVSRITYTSLFQKMKEYNIAKITSMGTLRNSSPIHW